MRVLKNEKISNKIMVGDWVLKNNNKELSNLLGRQIRASFPKNYSYHCTGREDYFGSDWFTIRVFISDSTIRVGVVRDSNRRLPKNIVLMPYVKVFQWDFDGDLTPSDVIEICDTVNDYLKKWNPDDKNMMLTRTLSPNLLNQNFYKDPPSFLRK